jgi:hypothetical protein
MTWPGLRALGLALLVGAWLCGFVLFALADGHIEVSLPRKRAPTGRVENLAMWDLGPTVRASSYFADRDSHHHPLFLVDGRDRPSLVEKWASSIHDRHPWVEILWREPHDLVRVVLRHAGSVESQVFTVRRYVISCLMQAGRGPSVLVEDNQDAVAVRALACARARGIRVEFEPNDAGDIVRVYELETWGR